MSAEARWFITVAAAVVVIAAGAASYGPMVRLADSTDQALPWLWPVVPFGALVLGGAIGFALEGVDRPARWAGRVVFGLAVTFIAVTLLATGGAS